MTVYPRLNWPNKRIWIGDEFQWQVWYVQGRVRCRVCRRPCFEDEKGVMIFTGKFDGPRRGGFWCYECGPPVIALEGGEKVEL